MADDDAPKDDPIKVKQLLEWATRKVVSPETAESPPEIDPDTRAQLEAWFGLPSYQQLEERRAAEPPPLDPEIEKVREQRAAAIAAVDPKMVEAHRRRVERGDELIRFRATIDLGDGLRIDPDMPFADLGMIDRVGSIADPREVEITEELRDDMKDCTPQAILRDLHRVATDFDKVFDRTDFMLENRVDVSAIVAEVMRTSWGPELREPTFTEGAAVLRELRALRRVAYDDIPRPNRRADLVEDKP